MYCYPMFRLCSTTDMSYTRNLTKPVLYILYVTYMLSLARSVLYFNECICIDIIS